MWKVDPGSGQRTRAGTLDPQGLVENQIAIVHPTPGGKAGAVLSQFWNTELFVVEGLR